jgi:inner membrane protein
MKEQFGILRGTVLGKVLFVGFLILLLLVPMQMIEGLIRERSAQQQQALSEIGNRWGNEQTIGGPMLLVPFRYTQQAGDALQTVVDALYVMPESLSVDGTVDPQVLRRGIYEVPVYTATLELAGVLPPPSFDAAAYENLEVLWNEAEIVLPLTDPRPIREPVSLRLADAEAEF